MTTTITADLACIKYLLTYCDIDETRIMLVDTRNAQKIFDGKHEGRPL